MSGGIRIPAALVRAFLRLFGAAVLSPRTPIAVQRRLSDLGSRLPGPPRGTRVERGTVGGVPGDWVRPPGVAARGAILYLHGGGYNLGSPKSHRGLVGHLCAKARIPAFIADYRLAPEHPHPAALEDALSAYRGLLDEGVPPQRIVLAGDSAGGGLALAMALALRDGGEPLPTGVAMICPWLDLRPDVRGERPEAPREPLLSPGALAGWSASYAAGADPAAESISPVTASLEDLPPLIVHYAGDDLLRSDAEALIARAKSEGIELDDRRFDGLWHDFHLQAGLLREADEAVRALGQALRRKLGHGGGSPRVAIVGAGMSGLCMAAKLRAAGHEDFTVFEKAEDVGGTWRENRYPGLTCDVPSRFYSYSFAPNPDWTHAFAPGAEIQGYFRDFAERFGLRPFIRFGTELTEATWVGERWRLRTSGGEEHEADVLVTATGVLHHPRVPLIEGLETFQGKAFHSARWDESAELDGRRVGVIGTGSTGVQIATALAPVAGRLEVFQRTAQWILPVPNRPYSPVIRAVLRRIPPINRFVYRGYQAVMEAVLGRAVIHPGWQRNVVSALCRANLRLGVRDPELRRKLTPDYRPMCKRLVMSAGFYRAVQRPNVEIVTERIERIEPGGIRTSDGTLHELDVIVLATGFDAHAYMRPMRIAGKDGVTLEEVWEDGPRAYRTVALPGFPNLFMLMGPHSPVGNQSLIAVAEAQAEYALCWIEAFACGAARCANPKPQATEDFNASMRAAMPRTVWATGCRSWYLGKDGLPELWPWSPGRHRAMLREPELEDFEIAA